MNDSVDSDAFVMPSSSGSPLAGVPPFCMMRSFSSSKMCFSTCSSTRKFVSPDVGDADAAQHLANDHLDVLVVDLHALESVDLLDFVDQVLGERLLAEHLEDVVRVGRRRPSAARRRARDRLRGPTGACPWRSGTPSARRPRA